MKIFLSLFSFHCTYYECSLLFSPLFIEFLMFHILEGPILHCIKYFYLCEALLSILVYLILTRHSHCPTVHLLRLREGKGISQGSIETDRVRIKRRLDFLLCQIPKTLGRFSWLRTKNPTWENSINQPLCVDCLQCDFSAVLRNVEIVKEE